MIRDSIQETVDFYCEFGDMQSASYLGLNLKEVDGFKTREFTEQTTSVLKQYTKLLRARGFSTEAQSLIKESSLEQLSDFTSSNTQINRRC